MYFDFCIQNAHSSQTRYPVDTIFYICGDSSYRTPHKMILPNKNYFLCTIKGTGLVWYDGKCMESNEGSCVFLQPTHDFGYRCKNDCWHFWWFEFVGDCAPFTPNEELHTSINDFKMDLFSQSLLYAKEGRWDIAAHLFECACEILHHSALTCDESPRTIQWKMALHYIRDNLRTVTVANLCQSLQIQERTLRNIFYTNCGRPPKQVILKERLTKGRELLEITALPIANISAQLGFSSQFHFSRAFKKHYDQSPLQYRTQFLLHQP